MSNVINLLHSKGVAWQLLLLTTMGNYVFYNLPMGTYDVIVGCGRHEIDGDDVNMFAHGNGWRSATMNILLATRFFNYVWLRFCIVACLSSIRFFVLSLLSL